MRKTNNEQELLSENEKLKLELAKIKGKFSKTKSKLETLIAERKMFLSLTYAVPYGIYQIKVLADTKTSEEQWQNSVDAPFRVLFVNKRFCEILNIDKEAFIKTPGIIFDYINKEDKSDFAKKNAEANLKEIPFKWEGRFFVNEKIIYAHFESLPKKQRNGDINWTGILYDISERRRAEAEILEMNLELKKMNDEKDKLFSIIAHDLKSPFNSILGFSELLIEKIRNKDNEAIKEYSEIILNSSKKANQLIANLMEWSLLQSGRMNVFPEFFDINFEIDNVTNLFYEIARQKTITINKNTPKTTIAYGDKVMINTIIRNLVSNAIKFTRDGGAIIISAKKLKNEILISVIDTGEGIPPTSLHKLFSLVENISTHGTQNEKGTGLGLILCKEFIEKNNGKIWVESTQNVGSKFHFTVPNGSN
ncbi:PAS domain-containing sensor histidine kinase [uncultured Draconibacterium sp.]|uniref:PAS domain-containing sensor histidine kinase n=1 Tax=uncultured Draconibacterium sp. TaxID=1573823 RepID=UPI003216E5BF